MPPIGPKLRVVSFNDVYSLENLPRLKGLIDRLRREDPADAFVVVLAGDFLAPSILSSLDAGRGMVDCLNAIGVDYVIFGNHEDDVAPAELRMRIAQLRATWINTNVLGYAPDLPRHAILRVAQPGGRTIEVGLVGVVMSDPTVYRDKAFGGAGVLAANDSALTEAASLLADKRCACVVPMTHQPIDDDRALAKAPISPPFPLIIGGHEHVPFLERIGHTWIVKAGKDAENVIVADLTWAPNAPATGLDLPDVQVRLVAVQAEVEDIALRARVDALMIGVQKLERATLMTLAPGQTLSSVGTRARATTMGTLICSRLRDTLGAEACLFNGGGIRAARDYHHHVTYGDIQAEVPFDNEVVVARLPGAVVGEAVRASRAHAPDESGGFLQVDDRVRVDEHGVVTAIDGAPLEAAREYRVALIRNLFDGMDHVEPLIAFAREHPDRVPPPDSGREVKVVLVDSFAVALWRTLGGFDAVDVNHDGIVTPDEIASAVARATHEAPSSIVGDLVVHALDANSDRQISRAEAEGVEAPASEPPSKRAR